VASDHLREHIISNVARLLRETRQQRGISKNILSQRAGLSRQTITFIEEQQRKPTLDTLLRISEVLGVDIEDIIGQARRVAKRSTPKE
jgi:DNA-binding XRE family transcriptional regulator